MLNNSIVAQQCVEVLFFLMANADDLPNCEYQHMHNCVTGWNLLKSSKKLLHVSVFDRLQGVTMSSLISQLFCPELDIFMLRVVIWKHVVLFVSG